MPEIDIAEVDVIFSVSPPGFGRRNRKLSVIAHFTIQADGIWLAPGAIQGQAGAGRREDPWQVSVTGMLPVRPLCLRGLATPASEAASDGRSRRMFETTTRKPSSVILAELLGEAPAQQVTLDWLMSRLGDRSFGMILLIVAPLGLLPGISIFIGPC